MYRPYLAFRWLLSRPINLLGMAGVMVSTWALILVVSIFSGFLREVRSHARSVTSDLTVLNLPWPCDYDEVEAILREDPNVAAAAPRMVWYGLLNALESGASPLEVTPLDAPGAESPLVSLVGIEPELEIEVTGLRDWLAAVPEEAQAGGDPAELLRDQDGRPTLLVSARRAVTAGLLPGTLCKVTSGSPGSGFGTRPEPFNETFLVRACFASRHTAFDNSTCFVHADTMRRLLASDLSRAATEVVVRCVDESQAEATAERLERALTDLGRGSILVRTWEQMNIQLLSAVDHQRGLMKLVLLVIMIVAAFLMFATLSMMVTEKTRDIGVLTAMGATRTGVLAVFLASGFAITALGAVLGIVLGCFSAVQLDTLNSWLREHFDIDLFPTHIYNLDRVPYELDPWWILQVAAAAMLTGLIVAGIPAWRAARHDPVASLRAE